MGISSCSRCKLFLEDGTEDQAYERSDVKYLGAQRKRKVLYQFRQPVTEQFRTQSHVIDGDVECHHRRHHGYGKSGCGEDDKDRFVFTRCKYTAHEPFYDRGGYVTLRNECADHLQKLLTKLCCDDLLSWAKRSNHLKNRLGKLLLQKPTLVRGAFVNEIDSSKKIDEQLVSRQEMEAFVKAADALTDKRFQAEMIQIVEKMEPNLRPGKPTNMRIDVVEMKVSTMRALIEYAKAAYARVGKPYPE